MSALPAEPDQIIYIIDDDEALRDSLVWLLESSGYRVQALESAERFLARYDENLTGCLVLDVRMPGMSGLETLTALRRGGVTVPILMMTADNSAETLREVMALGGSGYVLKPFDAGDLIARVLRSTELTNKSDVLASALTVEEQRLLGVAMALATRPSVLLLDEPFAGLREAEMPRLRSVLERLKGERLAIVIIEHKLKVLTTLSDYMYVLDQGKVISSGVPGVVLNDPVVIEAYLGSSHADVA